VYFSKFAPEEIAKAIHQHEVKYYCFEKQKQILQQTIYAMNVEWDAG
jgi:hypothetical protein